MKRIVVIITLFYYTLGSLVLPCSDFSLIPELPFMYGHCLNEEDKDMTLSDFITDHLLNLDGIFDAHLNGDEQKPHQAPVHHVKMVFQPVIPPLCDGLNVMQAPQTRNLISTIQNRYAFDFSVLIFRPPMA